ncbi:MAG TPA: hypothetical protein VMP68_32290 [Candidatus Eisenbacteria bacterium]|nr:hypothetical protein [Candidatus Eisenbacteria bacterium]
MPKLRWFTWVGVLGAGILGWGLLWLAVSPYVVHAFDRVELFTSVVNSSIGSEILAVVAAVSLAMAGVDWLRRR